MLELSTLSKSPPHMIFLFFFSFLKKPSADNLLVYLTVNFRFPAVSTFTLHDLNAPYIGMNPSRGRLMICPSKISLNTKQSIVISQCWHFFTLLLNNMNHISNLHQLSFSLQWICLCVSQQLAFAALWIWASEWSWQCNVVFPRHFWKANPNRRPSHRMIKHLH